MSNIGGGAILKIKRNLVAGNTPTTAQLDAGELAVNVADGTFFVKKVAGGNESIQKFLPDSVHPRMELSEATGLSLLGQALSVASGYEIPTSEKVINWDIIAASIYGDGYRVAIGTLFPLGILHVEQMTVGIGTVSNAAGGTTVTGTGTLFTITFAIGDSITIGGQTVAISAIASNTSMTVAAITNANTNVAYSLAGGSRFVVLGNGQIGIGTSLPTKMLEVVNSNTGRNAAIQITNNGGIGGAAFQMSDTASNTAWYFKATSAGDFKIRDNTSSLDVVVINKVALANAIYIKAGGNIGLGISTGIDAKLTFAAGTTPAAGIQFGADTNLYRSDANHLKTDDKFHAAQFFVNSLNFTPDSETIGQAGEVCITADYIYVCSGGTSWKRVALSTF